MSDTQSLASQNRIVIGGKYEVMLDSPLGSGGLATVYRGRDLRSRRDVAIKTLRSEFRDDPESRRRFRQEARMMAFASHPGLVTIFDLIEQPDASWIVMEMVPGQNLKQIVERDGPLKIDEAVRVVRDVSAALEHLHSRKIVHLDIKPQNIINTPVNGIKLIDFGLAQSVAPRQDTIGGTAFGTAAYLSPEQGRGEAVDERTDVYALGCVFYELVTGRPPFDAPEGPNQKQEIIDLHLTREPDPPSGVRPDLAIPYWVDDLVARALEKQPVHRYPSVQAFAEAAIAGLARGDAADTGAPTQALPSLAGREPRLQFRRRRPAAAGPDVDELDDVPEPRRIDVDPGPSPAKRAWMMGGRLARRSRPLHSTIWKLVMVFAIANLLLGAVLMIRQGPEALAEQFLNVVPGTETNVTVDSLNVRGGPGSVYDVITTVEAGDRVRVTGLSQSDEQGRWWPIEFERNGDRVEGWVWEGGLQPNTWTGRLSFMQDAVDGVQDTKDSIADLWPF